MGQGVYERKEDDPTNPTAIGTGGSEFMTFLREHLDIIWAHKDIHFKPRA